MNSVVVLALIAVIVVSAPFTIVVYRLTESLDPTSKGILLGILSVGFLMVIRDVAQGVYLIVARKADEREFMQAISEKRDNSSYPEVREIHEIPVKLIGD